MGLHPPGRMSDRCDTVSQMNEMPWKVGDLVRLPGQPVWGLGRILRTRADYVDMFFVDGEGTDAVALSQKKCRHR